MNIIEPLYQAHQRRLAGTGRADDAEPLASRNVEAQIAEQEIAVGKAEADVLEPDGSPLRDERLHPWKIGYRVRRADFPQGFRDQPQLLSRAEEGKGEVAGAVEYAECQRAHQYHLAGCDPVLAPELERPRQYGSRHQPQEQIVQDSGFLLVHPAPLLAFGFQSQMPGQALPLALPGGECLYRPDISHDVDQFAIRARTLFSITTVYGLAAPAAQNQASADDRDKDA